MRRILVLVVGMVFACTASGTPASVAMKSAPLLWVRDGALTQPATQLLQELLLADQRGLRPADYQALALERRARELRAATSLERAAFDEMLSAAASRLVLDLHTGRVRPSEIGYDLDVGRPAFDLSHAVHSLASSPDIVAELNGLEPQLTHYALLKSALSRYRALATAFPVVHLAALPESRVRPGETYQGAATLRTLLVALGDLESTEPAVKDNILNPSLVTGLRRFQARHGLDADGVLGRATYRALTIPLSARVQQIELSLERMRWLPSLLDAPPIVVNIPQFRLFAFRTTQDRSDEIVQMNVIVGEAFKGRRTPVFAADMKYVVLNPYWDVPRSILLQELLPDIQKNPQWIDQHGYEIVKGDSDAAAPLPANRENVQRLAQGALRLRQKPGAANALGRVKFMFPNRHNVYLHDTPAQSLFLRTRRAFSHGCIRVSDPMALLAHVIGNDPTWTDERREAALRSGRTVRIPLTRPIRVFILYGTALATEAGSVLFFDDIYQQDAPLLARLATRSL